MNFLYDGIKYKLGSASGVFRTGGVNPLGYLTHKGHTNVILWINDNEMKHTKRKKKCKRV